MFFIISLQRLPISFKTHCDLRISENVHWASKHASFLGYNYYDTIIQIPQHLLSCLIVFFFLIRCRTVVKIVEPRGGI